MVYNTHLANLEVFYESKEKYKKNLLGLSFSLLIVPAFTIKSSAGLLATDSVSANHYNAVASGYLAVYDNYAYATTNYARSGSDIGVGASIDATYRYGGKNNVLNDVDTSSGGGATARVDISVNEQPTAAFLHVRGVHQVSVSQLPSGYWMDITEWTR